MSGYKIINLEPIKISHFVSIEHGGELISLSIHEGKEFKEALLTSEQALALADELIERAKLIQKKTVNQNNLA